MQRIFDFFRLGSSRSSSDSDLLEDLDSSSSQNVLNPILPVSVAPATTVIAPNQLNPSLINRHEEINEDSLVHVGAVDNHYNDLSGVSAPQKEEMSSTNATLLLEQIAKKLLENYPNADKLVDIPDEFLCPITMCLMVDPVRVYTHITNNKQEQELVSHYFEKAAIENWLNTNKVNPLNCQPIIKIEPALALREKIKAFVSNPDNLQQEEQEVNSLKL